MAVTTSGARAATQIQNAEQDSWENAAANADNNTSASPAAPPPAGTTQPASPATATGAPSGVSFPATTPPPQAPVVTSQKRSGIMGVIDNIADALTGRTTPEVGTDQFGNKYVKQDTLTHGQQWMRIAGEALHGAAAGLAAGKGAGNQGRAPLAGYEAAQQDDAQRRAQEQQMTTQARQQNLDNANNQMLRMQMAEQAWKFTRMQQEATQADVTFAQGQVDRLVKEGGTILGTAEHPADIGNILKVNPDVMQDMIQKHQIEIMPHYNPDGSAGGLTVVKMPDGYRTTLLPAGTLFHTFDQTTGKYIEHHASAPMTAGERDDYEHSAGIAALKFQTDKAEVDLKQQQAAEAMANAGKAPSEIREANARANEANAAASKDVAEANKLKNPTADDPQIASLGEQVAQGALTEDEISKFGKGTLGAVQSYLAEHHPNLDQTSVFLDANSRKVRMLANNAVHNLDTISDIVKRRPDVVGKINGLLSQGKKLTGTDDQAISDIVTALDNYALAGTGAHGVRAVEARESARNAILNNFKNGPNAIQGSIDTAKGSLLNLASIGKPKGINGQPYIYNRQQPAGGNPPAAAPNPPANNNPAPVKIIPGEPTAKQGNTTLVVRNGQWVPAVQ